MVTVKLCSKASGKPIRDVKVLVSFTSVGRGWLEEWTDSSGGADFDTDPGDAVVYVHGSPIWKGHLSGRVVVCV
jgi:hypothetical protein